MSSARLRFSQPIDLRSHLLMNDKGCHSTTMADYDALPQTGQKAWLGRAAANAPPNDDKARTVQDATLDDLAQHLGMAKQEVRFMVMHEFEALPFSDCTLLAKGIDRKELGVGFEKQRDQIGSPEEIDDSQLRCPPRVSKLSIRGIRSQFWGF